MSVKTNTLQRGEIISMASTQSSNTPLAVMAGGLLIAIGFAAGYLIGQQNAKTSDSPEIGSAPVEGESRQIAPHAQSVPPSLPPHHPVIPPTDPNGHPVFNCDMVARPLPKPEGEGVLTLEQLHSDREKLVGQPVKARAIIVKVYAKIMGTNWYHLCDAPRGRVFVVSSTQQAPPGSIVQIAGELKLNHEVGGVYTFPLFVQDAKLEGEGVRDDPNAASEARGTVEL